MDIGQQFSLSQLTHYIGFSWLICVKDRTDADEVRYRSKSIQYCTGNVKHAIVIPFKFCIQ